MCFSRRIFHLRPHVRYWHSANCTPTSPHCNGTRAGSFSPSKASSGMGQAAAVIGCTNQLTRKPPAMGFPKRKRHPGAEQKRATTRRSCCTAGLVPLFRPGRPVGGTQVLYVHAAVHWSPGLLTPPRRGPCPRHRLQLPLSPRLPLFSTVQLMLMLKPLPLTQRFSLATA